MSDFAATMLAVGIMCGGAWVGWGLSQVDVDVIVKCPPSVVEVIGG